MNPSTPLVFDRALRRRRLARAARHGGGAQFLRNAAAMELLDRALSTTRTFERALSLGGGSAIAASLATGAGQDRIRGLVSTDLAAEALVGARSAIVVDEERLSFAPASFDLVLSPLSLHATNDLPGALIQARQALAPDGLFIAALFGRGTLKELGAALLEAEAELRSGASPRIAPFADARDMAGLLQRAGFAMPVSDVDRLTVRYSDPIALMRDLRAMGETNVRLDRALTPLRRDVLARACAIYARDHTDADGRVRASFEVVYATGWAPHPDQPTPKRPGSATVRLADALGVSERSAGEKAGGG